MPKPEKAYIRLYKATKTGPGASLGKEVKFQFNPKDFTVKKSATWERKESKAAGKTATPEFKGAGARTMTIDVFLDATEEPAGDVSKQVEILFECCTPLGESVGKKLPSPPLVVFGWGKKVSVSAYVKDVSSKYTLFRPDGTPIRAECQVSLEEFPGNPPPQNPTSGGPPRRSHILVAGESLATVAYDEYGQPGLWRAIALTNGIADPLRLRPGMSLLIPSADDAMALA